jgi:hypothetical protein
MRGKVGLRALTHNLLFHVRVVIFVEEQES